MPPRRISRSIRCRRRARSCWRSSISSTRRIDAFDPVILTVTQLDAGSAINVIPEAVRLRGTLRSFSAKSRAAAHEGLRRVAQGIAQAHGLEASVEIEQGYNVTRKRCRLHGLRRARDE